jgi:hypothetical protein
MTRSPRSRCLLSSRAERRGEVAGPEADGRVVERSRNNILHDTVSGNSLKFWWLDLPAVPMTARFPASRTAAGVARLGWDVGEDGVSGEPGVGSLG